MVWEIKIVDQRFGTLSTGKLVINKLGRRRIERK